MTNGRSSDTPIMVGISSCLLGYKVRFDAGHKQDRYITDVLAPYFQFVPVCPEVEVGMPVPREAVQLEGNPESPRMVGNKTRTDWTDRMNKYSVRRLREFEKENLSGFILKKESPSCGMKRVRVHQKGMPSRMGRGLYGGALIRHFPLLPVEEEGRLNDARLRENFIVRVFAYHSLQRLFSERFSRKAVVEFHTANKYLLMAHSPKHFKILGQLVAAIKKYGPADFREKYSRAFMEGLNLKTTVKKNVNVLHHIMGFLKTQLSADDKKYILNVVEDYRHELVPLIVPLTLIRHYVEKHRVEYIINQTYLNPHPKELMLRNHV